MNVLSPVDEKIFDSYKFGCYSIIASCIIESLAEAPVFVAQVFCFVKLKVVLDTLHIFVRSVAFIFLIVRNPEHAIFAFSIAQVGSAVALVSGYYLYFYHYIKKSKNIRKSVDKEHIKKETKDADELIETIPFNSLAELVPGYLNNTVSFANRPSNLNKCVISSCFQGARFNTDLQTLVWSFFKQGLLKQILTEGEKYVMSVSPILTFHEQATYDIVNNLGSLAARFIFRPIEDNSYFYFTQTITRNAPLAKQKRVSRK